MEDLNTMLSLEGFRLWEDLRDGRLSEKQFHSKKWYAKSTNNVKMLIALSSAWEVYKLGN